MFDVGQRHFASLIAHAKPADAVYVGQADAREHNHFVAVVQIVGVVAARKGNFVDTGRVDGQYLAARVVGEGYLGTGNAAQKEHQQRELDRDHRQ